MTATTPTEPPPYPHCGHGADGEDRVGCRGHRVTRPPAEGSDTEGELYGACLAHINDSDRSAYLASLRPGSDLDHRGTTFNAALLGYLLHALRDPSDHRPRFGTVKFGGATFQDVRFRNVVFEGVTWFSEVSFQSFTVFEGASFKEEAWFDGATFTHSAGFQRATFERTARLYGATFESLALFEETAFNGAARFDGSIFKQGANFNRAKFKGGAGFERTTFKGDTRFREGTFEGVTRFDRAVFKGETRFDEAAFNDDTVFDGAAFEGLTSLTRAEFKGDTLFDGASFENGTGFDEATFGGNTRFYWAKFQGNSDFDKTTFKGDASFDDATFAGNLGLEQASFETAPQLGPLVCRGTVNLAAAVFSVAITLEISASRVDCRRTRWASTAALRLRNAVVDLSDAVLEFPVSVGQLLPMGGRVLDESGHDETPVRVASLHGVDASHLVLTDVDLTNCRFAGTIHLDQLRLHGSCTLPTTPAGLRRRGLIPMRWTSRQTLAEEHHWRATRGRAGAGWAAGPEWRALEPAALAPVYRELRKGFEDSKNEPGASDFYYGEMEMRRHNPLTPRPERALLWLYWAASGYGLRASRALGWLLGAMTITVLLMVGFGLPDTPAKPYPSGASLIGKQNPQLHADFPNRFTTARTHKAADVVINSVVFRSSGQALTTAGRYTEMASRFTEPVLLALALLAVRGRVKR